jgi:hypothetical protein
MGSLSKRILAFGGRALFLVSLGTAGNGNMALADELPPDGSFDTGYGDLVPFGQTTRIAEVVAQLKRAKDAFPHDHRKADDLEDGVRNLVYALDNRGALPAPGPGVARDISPRAIRALLSELRGLSGSEYLSGHDFVDEIGHVLGRLAAQDSVSASERADIERQTIALTEHLHEADQIIQGLGELGSAGRLSEHGQLQLLGLALEKCSDEGAVFCANALRQVRPKSRALVDRILSLLNDSGVLRRGQLPMLAGALETEYANPRVVRALIGIVRDPGQDGFSRSAAIEALLLGSGHILSRPSALRNRAIREAILACSRMPGGPYDSDVGVNTAKRVIAAFPGMFPATDDAGLTEHNPALAGASSGRTTSGAPVRH